MFIVTCLVRLTSKDNTNTIIQIELFEAVDNRDILLSKPRRIPNCTQEFRTAWMDEWMN